MANSLATYFQRLPKQTRAIVATCLYGLVAGAVAVAFHKCIHWLFAHSYENFMHESKGTFLVLSFCVIISTSLAVGILLNNFCKAASGSGIPQLKVAFWKEFGVVPMRVVWVKFVAGVLSVGGGCSLGREGPSVQLAGGLSSNLAEKIGEAKQGRRTATAAGAAAGLAAAFNTPVAAVTFVLEEIIQDLNSRYLGSILLASVIGALVAHAVIGEQPAFQLGYITDTTWYVFVLIPVVSAVAALVGMYFQKCTLDLRGIRKGFENVPMWIRPAIGGLITWILGCSVFLMTGSIGVFGLGYADLSAALTTNYDWTLAGVLLVTKLVATIACYGFGGCGGIFAPTLFFGGMCGIFMSGLLGAVLPLEQSDQILLAVVGMSSCMGAVVRAPVTSILIVFEMTHEFSLVPALMVGTLVSQAISRKMAKRNFYEELLHQDGHNLEHVIPPRDLRSWHQLPVSAIANFEPALIRDLNPVAVRAVLKANPYQTFPVVIDKQLKGIVTRREAEEALEQEREIRLLQPFTCRPSQTIRELQLLLIESTTGMVVLVDKPGGRVLGLVTLHDLLRAEVNNAREGSG